MCFITPFIHPVIYFDNDKNIDIKIYDKKNHEWEKTQVNTEGWRSPTPQSHVLPGQSRL